MDITFHRSANYVLGPNPGFVINRNDKREIEIYISGTLMYKILNVSCTTMMYLFDSDINNFYYSVITFSRL